MARETGKKAARYGLVMMLAAVTIVMATVFLLLRLGTSLKNVLFSVAEPARTEAGAIAEPAEERCVPGQTVRSAQTAGEKRALFAPQRDRAPRTLRSLAAPRLTAPLGVVFGRSNQ